MSEFEGKTISPLTGRRGPGTSPTVLTPEPVQCNLERMWAIITLGYRVISLGAEGMTPPQAFQGKPTALYQTILPDGLMGVLGAGGHVATHRG